MKKENNPTKDTNELFRKAELLFKAKAESKKQFIEKYGYIRIPQMIDSGESKLVVVGGSIFRQTRPGDYTFIHAVHDYALHFFGEDYLKKQETLETERRHPALQWMYAFVEQTQSKENDQMGAGAAWLRFAYDLYTISDNATLVEKMKKRLLDRKYFQGARHELWTAALFITANFEVNFIDETDSTQKYPEFIAVDNVTGVSMAVEAKSRHRRGILGFKEGSDKPLGEKVNIRQLISKAYKKESGLPFCVVVNTNLPPQSKNWNFDYWLNEINQTMDTVSADPSPANLILFYNDPSHYMINKKIGESSDSLWISGYVPKKPKNACEQMLTFHDRLIKAFRQRLHPPPEIPAA